SGKSDSKGESMKNPADFLDNGFWSRVKLKLRTTPVKVVFLEGEYRRAYTEKPLVINEMGNSQNLLTIQGQGNVTFTVPKIGITRSALIDIRNSQNMRISNFRFTGHGKVGY